MSLTPLVFMSVGIFISFKYKIDAKKQKEIKEAIEKQINVHEIAFEL